MNFKYKMDTETIYVLTQPFCLCFNLWLHAANARFTPSGQTGDGRTALNDKYGY